MSYNATREGNASNDASQALMLEAQARLLDQMQLMTATQHELVKELAAMRKKMDMVGELMGWEYCTGYPVRIPYYYCLSVLDRQIANINRSHRAATSIST